MGGYPLHQDRNVPSALDFWAPPVTFLEHCSFLKKQCPAGTTDIAIFLCSNSMCDRKIAGPPSGGWAGDPAVHGSTARLFVERVWSGWSSPDSRRSQK